jgi:hypothetical protein
MFELRFVTVKRGGEAKIATIKIEAAFFSAVAFVLLQWLR